MGTARRSSERTEEGLLVSQAEEALEEIVEAISKVGERTDEIAAASEEQSATSEQVAQSVQSISTAAQESAAGVTQLSGTADELESLTEKLRTATGQFELGSEGHGASPGSTQASANPGTSGEGAPKVSFPQLDGHPSGNASLQ